MYSCHHSIVGHQLHELSLIICRVFQLFHFFRELLLNLLVRFVAHMRFYNVLVAALLHFQLKTKEFWILPFQINNSRFLRANIQPQPIFQPFGCCMICLYCILMGWAKNLEIVRIPNRVHFFQITAPQCPIDVAFYFCTWTILPYREFRSGRHIFPLGCNPPVQFVQHDISQQWRKNSALRRTLGWVNLFTIRQDNRGF